MPHQSEPLMRKLEFISIEEVVISFIPTGMTYYSMVESIENIYAAVATSVIIFICFIVILYQKNVGTYKKALSEVLATGYFKNFVECLSQNLTIDGLNIIEFEDDEKQLQLSLDQIRIEIILPTSISSLSKVNEDLDSRGFKRVFLNNRMDKSAFWARAVKDKEGIIIKDFPRTLYSLSEYVAKDFKTDYTEKVSRKYHDAFIKKFNALMTTNASNSILKKFQITVI